VACIMGVPTLGLRGRGAGLQLEARLQYLFRSTAQYLSLPCKLRTQPMQHCPRAACQAPAHLCERRPALLEHCSLA
jgi:hypothetical protein